jgi:hypothetical protein
MTMRCDHCREELGLTARRYWRMRFCSEACKCAYQRRLDAATRDKIGRLDRVKCIAPQTLGDPIGSRSRTALGRRFAA